MKYDKNAYTKHDFHTNFASGYGWYIVHYNGVIYIHRDESLHDYCGKKNFSKVKTDAEQILEMVFPIFEKELFEI
jgi:hypothetical protein